MFWQFLNLFNHINMLLFQLNLFKRVRVIFSLAAVLLSTSFLAQKNEAHPAVNSKKQMMLVQESNFTSFSVPEVKGAAWRKFNKGYSQHPEFGKLPFNANYPGFVEVLEKRQKDERYFVNESNPSEFRIQKALGALHYKVNGDWITIDNRITAKGNGIYEASMQYDPVGFDVIKGKSYIKTPTATVYFNKWTLYGADVNGSRTALANANWSNYTAGDDGIYVTDFFPGIDAQMSVSRGSVKTNFIVKQLNFSGYSTLLFQDEYDSPLSSYFKFKDADINLKHAPSELSLMEGNTSVLEIGAAVAWPKGGTREERIVAEYLIEENNLLVALPVDWIKKNIKNNYVIIDPLVTSANSLAQAIGSEKEPATSSPRQILALAQEQAKLVRALFTASQETARKSEDLSRLLQILHLLQS